MTGVAGMDPASQSYDSNHIPLNYIYIFYYKKVDAVDFQQHADYVVANGVYQVSSFHTCVFSADATELIGATSYVFILQIVESISCTHETIMWTSDDWIVGTCGNR